MESLDIEIKEGEHCSFAVCRHFDRRPFYCQHCDKWYCQQHRERDGHGCATLNAQQNKNVKTVSTAPSLPAIHDDVDDDEDDDIADGEILECRYAPCTKTNSANILSQCNTCRRQYCSLHYRDVDHDCEHIKFTAEEIAFQNGYYRCSRCSFVNPPQSTECMVCDMLSATKSVATNSSYDCTWTLWTPSKRSEKQSRLTALFATGDAARDEIKCPHCKAAIDELKFEAHLRKCDERHNIVAEDGDDAAADAQISMACEKCGQYQHYREMDRHALICDGTGRTTTTTTTQKTELCPSCNERFPVAEYAAHLDICLNQNLDALPEPKQACPICQRSIDPSRYARHVQICATDDDDDIDMDLNDADSSSVRKQLFPKASKQGIEASEVPARVHGRGMKRAGRRMLAAANAANRTFDRQRPAQSHEKRLLLHNSNVTPQKRSLPSARGPAAKRRKFQHSSITDSSTTSATSVNDDDESETVTITEDNYRENQPNTSRSPPQKPYHRNTYFCVQERKKNATLASDLIYCHWFFPAQHNYDEQLFQITRRDFGDVGSDHCDLSDDVMDFALRYIYSGWLESFKAKMFIFPARFYDQHIKDCTKETQPERFEQFIFSKDFLVIPRKNEWNHSWEFAIICYPARVIQHATGNEKPCIVFWNVMNEKPLGLRSASSAIRCWLDIQHRYFHPGEQSTQTELFTASKMKAHYDVAVSKTMSSSDAKQTGFYQLCNLKAFGQEAGYKNTVTKTKLDNVHLKNGFGRKQALDQQAKIVSIMNELHALQ